MENCLRAKLFLHPPEKASFIRSYNEADRMYNGTLNMEECIRGLQSSETHEQNQWLQRLENAVLYEKVDVNPVLPFLLPFLTHAEDRIRKKAMYISRMAIYRNRIDPAPVLPELKKAFEDAEKPIAWNAALAYSYHQLNVKDWQTITDLLRHPRAIVRLCTTSSCSSFALARGDILPLLPELIRALKDPDRNVGNNAATVLAYCYLNTGNREALQGLLQYPAFLEKFSSATRDMIPSCKSLELLDRFSTLLEGLFTNWWNGQPQQASPEKIRMAAVVSRELGAISKRRTELAKRNDGELLAGETIPVPRNRRERGIYRTTGRVC